jgi:hypothetical protein
MIVADTDSDSEFEIFLCNHASSHTPQIFSSLLRESTKQKRVQLGVNSKYKVVVHLERNSGDFDKFLEHTVL